MADIRVLYCETGKEARELLIKDDLHVLQGLVGGLIECVGIDNNVDIICNDSGKLGGFEPNRPIYCDGEIFDVVFGDFIIAGVNNRDGNFKSLTDKQVEKYKEIYGHPCNEEELYDKLKLQADPLGYHWRPF